MRKTLTAVLFVLACSIAAHAQTFYVATTGNDGNSCVQAQNVGTPKQTIQSGIGCLGAGDTLQIRQGTYHEIIGFHLFSIPSGTAGNVITMMSYPGETATIDGTLDLTPAVNESLLTFFTTKYWTIKDLKFDGRNQVRGGLSITGDTLEEHGIIIQNNEITRIPLNGILTGFAYGVDLIGNHIHDVGKNGDFDPPYGYGVYYSGGNGIIDGNHIHDVGRYGIQLYVQAVGHLHDNIIRNNRIHDTGVMLAGGPIFIGGEDHQVYNNLLYDSDGHGIDVNYVGPDNIKIYNNTIYNNTLYGISIGNDGGATGTLVRNNIVFSNDTGTIDNQGTGTVQSNQLTTDPSFVNAAGEDFHLAMGSAAIGGGVAVAEVTVDLDGVTRANPPDIGAYQFAAGGGGGGGTRPHPLAPRNLRTLVK